MDLVLREHLHWCVCAGRVVFLDLAADRYFCLTQPTGEAFRRLAANAFRDGDREQLAGLVQHGVLSERAGAGGIADRCAPTAVTGDLGEASDRARLPDIFAALLAERAARRALRRGALLRMAHAVQGMGPGSSSRPVGSRRLGQIVAAFAATALLRGSADRCLARAFALQATCRRHGLASSLVIGVRMNPFRAHAWVQRGDKVLVGDFEQARTFTPILMLE